MKKKIGIITKSFIDWSGGVDFIVYIANGLALNQDYDLFMLLPDSPNPIHTRIEDKESLTLTRGNILEQWKSKIKKPDSNYNKALVEDIKLSLNNRIKIVYYSNSPRGFINCMKRLKLDAVIPTTLPFGLWFPVPWVGYIWDFQHRYFPKYFSEHEKTERDKIFLNTLTEAPAIIVNSKETKKDIEKYYPKIKDLKKVITLPFAPSPKPEWLNINFKKIEKKYALPKRYIMVANQFWVHKDHLTAISAMKYLVDDPEFKDLHLICTGKMEEPRVPEYINNVKAAINTKGISDKIHFLGYLPKEDQISIMRNALAVVQPTLYEGGPGGGVAYNAVALGIPLIASDIKVNREILGEKVTLYKSRSPMDLSKKIKDTVRKPREETPNSVLIKKGDDNLQLLSKSLSISVEAAIKNFDNRKARK